MKARHKLLLKALQRKELLIIAAIVLAVALKAILPTDGIKVPSGDV